MLYSNKEIIGSFCSSRSTWICLLTKTTMCFMTRVAILSLVRWIDSQLTLRSALMKPCWMLVRAHESTTIISCFQSQMTMWNNEYSRTAFFCSQSHLYCLCAFFRFVVFLLDNIAIGGKVKFRNNIWKIGAYFFWPIFDCVVLIYLERKNL